VASGSPLLAVDSSGERYLTELMLAGAGNPPRGAWYIETPLSKEPAMRLAFREQGLDRQTWWPAARDNNPAWLLGRTSDEAEE
jgi:hypothetical protein